MSTIIQVKDLNLWYGAHHALHGVNIDIPEHEITALIGPSGCGKSTFLKTLNRMNDLVPGIRIEGEVNYAGQNIYAPNVDTTWLRKQIGMVFQKANPFPMSIYDNVAYGPRTHGIRSRAKLDEIVENSLRSAAIWDEGKDRLKKSALGLSGEKGLYYHHGDPQYAAGRPWLRQHGVFPAGGSGGVRQDGDTVLHPHGQAHRRLHHRPVRLRRDVR